MYYKKWYTLKPWKSLYKHITKVLDYNYANYLRKLFVSATIAFFGRRVGSKSLQQEILAGFFIKKVVLFRSFDLQFPVLKILFPTPCHRLQNSRAPTEAWYK